MKPTAIACRSCGNGIIKWRPNRQLCGPCGLKSLRESKRVWQANWRAEQKHRKAKAAWKSESAQREAAAYSEDYEEILGA